MRTPCAHGLEVLNHGPSRPHPPSRFVASRRFETAGCLCLDEPFQMQSLSSSIVWTLKHRHTADFCERTLHLQISWDSWRKTVSSCVVRTCSSSRLRTSPFQLSIVCCVGWVSKVAHTDTFCTTMQIMDILISLQREADRCCARMRHQHQTCDNLFLAAQRRA